MNAKLLHWVLAVVFGGGTLAFAIVTQISRTEPNGGWGNWADRSFGFFNDWIVVLAAAVGLLVAFAAFVNIRDSRRFREEDMAKDVITRTVMWVDAMMVLAGQPTPTSTAEVSNLRDLLFRNLGKAKLLLKPTLNCDKDLGERVKASHDALAAALRHKEEPPSVNRLAVALENLKPGLGDIILRVSQMEE